MQERTNFTPSTPFSIHPFQHDGATEERWQQRHGGGGDGCCVHPSGPCRFRHVFRWVLRKEEVATRIQTKCVICLMLQKFPFNTMDAFERRFVWRGCLPCTCFAPVSWEGALWDQLGQPTDDIKVIHAAVRTYRTSRGESEIAVVFSREPTHSFVGPQTVLVACIVGHKDGEEVVVGVNQQSSLTAISRTPMFQRFASLEWKSRPIVKTNRRGHRLSDFLHFPEQS